MARRWTVTAESPGGLFTDCPGDRFCPDDERQCFGVESGGLSIRRRFFSVGRFDDPSGGRLSGRGWHWRRRVVASFTRRGTSRRLPGDNKSYRLVDSNSSSWSRCILA